jgi:hypothetical protein
MVLATFVDFIHNYLAQAVTGTGTGTEQTKIDTISLLASNLIKMLSESEKTHLANNCCWVTPISLKLLTRDSNIASKCLDLLLEFTMVSDEFCSQLASEKSLAFNL